MVNPRSKRMPLGRSPHSRPGPRITVGIVEDDREVREAFRTYCNQQSDLRCTIAAESAEAFLTTLPATGRPDVVLMDIGLPGMSGIEAIRQVKRQFPNISVIMLTVYMDSQKVFDSLCAGASGYLLKTTPFNEIRLAISEVYGGGAPMSPQIARKVIEYFRRKEQDEAQGELTPKEREIVEGLVDGLSYKMIADRLEVTIETVRTHIKSIYQKLHIHSKAEAITKSLRGEI